MSMKNVMLAEIVIRNKNENFPSSDNVNGGCGKLNMGLCYNMNDKQCDNDNGNNNDSSD